MDTTKQSVFLVRKSGDLLEDVSFFSLLGFDRSKRINRCNFLFINGLQPIILTSNKDLSRYQALISVPNINEQRLILKQEAIPFFEEKIQLKEEYKILRLETPNGTSIAFCQLPKEWSSKGKGIKNQRRNKEDSLKFAEWSLNTENIDEDLRFWETLGAQKIYDSESYRGRSVFIEFGKTKIGLHNFKGVINSSLSFSGKFVPSAINKLEERGHKLLWKSFPRSGGYSQGAIKTKGGQYINFMAKRVMGFLGVQERRKDRMGNNG